MYSLKLIPKNLGLVKRLASEVNASQVFYQVKRNLTTNLFDADKTSEIIPNALYIDPTYNCNRNCLGCYVDKRSGVIPIEYAEAVADYAVRKDVNSIAWLGGEPLLKGSQDVLVAVTSNFPKVSFNFCTNGDFLDKELVDRMSKLGNLTPLISMDGFKQNHNFRRGEGSYEATERAMKLLKERRMLFGYVSTAMPHNREEIVSEEFVESMIKKGALVGVYTAYFCADSSVENLSRDEYFSFIKTLGELGDKFPLYVLSTDFGYMGRHTSVKPTKQLLAVSIGPTGDIRTERGTSPIARLGRDGTLDQIIASEKVQRRFQEKLNGTGGSERDNRLRWIQGS